MSDLEIKNRILEKAREHFFKFGFSRVTMSEIATELGMSKKTLYAYFSSKEDLLMASIKQMHEETSVETERVITDPAMDFGEKLNKLMSIIGAHHSRLDAWFLADLQKNVPGGWKVCDDFQRGRIKKNAAAIIHQGIQEGVFRSDVNEMLLVAMYMTLIQGLMTPEMLRQLPLSTTQLHSEMMRVLFGGVFTEKGRQKYLPHSEPAEAKFASEHEMD